MIAKGKLKDSKEDSLCKGTHKNTVLTMTIFSHVARFSSISTLLAFAVETGMQIHQMDVVTPLLNDCLKEEIYMQQPPRYTQPEKGELVCKLKNHSMD